MTAREAFEEAARICDALYSAIPPRRSIWGMEHTCFDDGVREGQLQVKDALRARAAQEPDAVPQVTAAQASKSEPPSGDLSNEPPAPAVPSATMPKLHRCKIEHDGTSPIVVEFYDNSDVEELRAYAEKAVRRAESAERQLAKLRKPTQKMLDAARDWSLHKYGKAIGNEAAVGCWQVMLAAAKEGT